MPPMQADLELNPGWNICKKLWCKYKSDNIYSYNIINMYNFHVYPPSHPDIRFLEGKLNWALSVTWIKPIPISQWSRGPHKHNKCQRLQTTTVLIDDLAAIYFRFAKVINSVQYLHLSHFLESASLAIVYLKRVRKMIYLLSFL